ncbi:MAG: nucleotidyl transferase AbiEii/AbiGii toxin family protein [Candidatus Binatia bacterium]|nr:nucleotidyl transferase AbiEii/AbiGii toxin family protein [Candidatus Binatia bacterium]
MIDWLEAENISCLIIGGVAASLLGRPRFTRDVDVLVSLEETRWETFIKAGDRFGFVPRIDDPVDFAHRSRVFLIRHKPTGVDIDIAVAGLTFEEESIEQAIWRKVGKLSLPLPTPENLIIMKAIAHRPQDMMDIKALVEANPKLNVRRIRRYVQEFSAALDMPDILTDLDKLLRGRRSPKRP